MRILNKMDIKIPTKVEEITAVWFTSVTGIPILQPETFAILPNEYSGVGNLSQIVRIGFKEVDCLRSFIIKLLPVTTTEWEQGLYEIVTSENMDGREVFFYSTLKSVLEKLVPELEQYFLKCHQAILQQASTQTTFLKSKRGTLLVLIFEDLQSLEFKMPNFAEGLSVTHFSQALKFVAQFHFAGELLQLQDNSISLLQRYPELNSWQCSSSSSMNSLEKFKSLSWFTEGLTFAVEKLFVANVSESLAFDFSQLIPYAGLILCDIVEGGREFVTVIHDDLWPHNFLCHPDGHLKVIDWQLLSFTDGAYDLSSFLLSTLPISEINESRLIEVLTVYYKLKEELYMQHKKENNSRTLDKFLQFFFSYGLSYSLVWFAMSCDSIYNDETYRPKLYRIFQFLWKFKIPQLLLQKVKIYKAPKLK